MKVFLGGTCNGSTWRDDLMPLLKANNIKYFNPVVKDWTPECQEQELYEREQCDVCLYVITPKMTGVYSIAEVVDDSNKRPRRTAIIVLQEDDEYSFNKAQLKSLLAVEKLVKGNGGYAYEDFASLLKGIRG